MKSKKALLLSGASLLMSAVLLTGTTFAWFTDSVTNENNHVEAGTLELTLNGGNSDPLFENDVVWEPGHSEQAVVTLENTGSLWLKYTMSFSNVKTTGRANLAEVLDVYKVDDSSATPEDLIPENKLDTMANLMKQGSFETDDGILAPQGEPAEGYEDSDTFTLVIKMQEDADSKYQNCGITFDVQANAAQHAYEKDGFGSNDYDKDAPYDMTRVSNQDEFLQAMQNERGILLAGDIALDAGVEFSYDAKLDLNGHTLTIQNGTASVKALSGTTLTVSGDGTVNGVLYADKNATLIVNAGENFTVNSKSAMGWVVYGAMGSAVEINGGVYTSPAEYNGAVIHSLGSDLTVKDAEVQVESASVMNSYGIYSNASTSYLENVTVNAQYSRAVYLSNQYGSSVIKGGTFITDKVAEGWDPNPTIQYAGMLDISGASITRVGTGILYKVNYPKPTQVEGLTQSDLTFVEADAAVSGYKDIDFA